MTEVKGKTANESRVFKTSRVFPTDLNDHNTLFGGKILAEMDMVASISASDIRERNVSQHLWTGSISYILFVLQIVLVMNLS